VVHIWLPVHPTSSSLAREHVRAALAKWGREHLSEDAELIASELTSNAIKAMDGSDPVVDRASIKPGMPDYRTEAFCLGIYETQCPTELVVLQVWDPVRTPPQLLHADLDEPGGRGLWLVECLSTGWGYRWLAMGGKVVWAALDALRTVGEPQ
jgi:hypothetical protein